MARAEVILVSRWRGADSAAALLNYLYSAQYKELVVVFSDNAAVTTAAFMLVFSDYVCKFLRCSRSVVGGKKFDVP